MKIELEPAEHELLSRLLNSEQLALPTVLAETVANIKRKLREVGSVKEKKDG